MQEVFSPVSLILYYINILFSLLFPDTLYSHILLVLLILGSYQNLGVMYGTDVSGSLVPTHLAAEVETPPLCGIQADELAALLGQFLLLHCLAPVVFVCLSKV